LNHFRLQALVRKFCSERVFPVAKISIAMATYNGEPFIRKQLESFTRQTLLPSELIVCDDGSADSTVSILSDFSRSAPFLVKVVNNPTRLGYTANFLQAARMCQGDLIAFSDQDDEWLPLKLERILQASRESDALVFAHAVEWIDKNGNPLGVVYPTDRRYRKYIRENAFHGHSMVIRRSLLEMTSRSLTPSNYQEVAGEVEIYHDVLLLEIAAAMNKLLFIPDVLVRWRVYSEIRHAWTMRAWTKELRPAPRARVSFADWMFPPDLAQRCAEGASYFRRRSALMACILRDLATCGRDGAVASARLTQSMNLMTKQADVMDLRARFYGPLTRKARIKLMLEGAAMGQYRSRKKGGVRIYNVPRDIVACLLHQNEKPSA
jgi:glycosyltransferase involved in cell wall biosynthesis